MTQSTEKHVQETTFLPNYLRNAPGDMFEVTMKLYPSKKHRVLMIKV